MRLPTSSPFWGLSLAVLGQCVQAVTDLSVGMDVSEALDAQNQGVVFKNLNGETVDAIGVVKDYGYEWARVRIMVDPDGTYGLVQDLDYVIETARKPMFVPYLYQMFSRAYIPSLCVFVESFNRNQARQNLTTISSSS